MLEGERRVRVRVFEGQKRRGVSKMCVKWLFVDKIINAISLCNHHKMTGHNILDIYLI